MVTRAAWLSITPELERELPDAVATLTAGRRAQHTAAAAERRKIEGLLLHRGQRRWLRYLHAIVELIEQRAACPDDDVQAARSCARSVIANHHNLLLALPGSGSRLTATDRARLSEGAMR
ncbi:MAG: hypothetical protein ACR2NR_23525 [Solirubrobacteraceae bacterium]